MRRKKRPFGAQRGFSLIETLVALGIIGTAISAVLCATSTGSMSTATLDEQVTVESLARTQMEITKTSPYNQAGYYTPMESYGFSISIDTVIVAEDIQEITVTVSREGKPLTKIADYKIDR